MQILKHFKNKLINKIQGSITFGLISIASLIAVNYAPESITFFPKGIFVLTFIPFISATFLSIYEFNRHKKIIKNIDEEKTKISDHKKTYELFEKIMNYDVLNNIIRQAQNNTIKIIDDNKNIIKFQYKRRNYSFENNKVILSLYLKGQKKPFLEIKANYVLNLFDSDLTSEKLFFKPEIKLENDYFESDEKIKILEDTITYINNLEKDRLFLNFTSSKNKNILYRTKKDIKAKSLKKTNETYKDIKIETPEICQLISKILTKNKTLNEEQQDLLHKLNDTIMNIHLIKTFKPEENSFEEVDSNIIENVYQNLLILENFDTLQKLNNDTIITTLNQHLQKFNEILDKKLNKIIEKTTNNICSDSQNKLKVLQAL